ncbi:LuxR C-terminal-related transcriptional regulator [Streptomyces hypolithicus]
MIRVLILHEARLFRSALVALLRPERTLDVSSACWSTAGSRSRSTMPHVYVVDADCPRSFSGFAASGMVPGTNGGQAGLLVLATSRKPGLLRRAYDARALGYVDKGASPERLVEAISKVAGGERFVDESLAFDLLQAAEMPLTRRELGVLSLAAEGLSIAEIAGDLHLSPGTVRNYMAMVTRKMGARNRVDAIRMSQSAGWL